MIHALIIYLRSKEGFSLNEVEEIEEILRVHPSSGNQLLLPHGVLIAFAGRNVEDASTADELLVPFKAFAAARPGIGIGWCVGGVIGEIDADGNFVAGPMGEVVNQAMASAG